MEHGPVAAYSGGGPAALRKMLLVPPHDLAVTLDWEYDWDFVRLIEGEAGALGLRAIVVTPTDVAARLEDCRSGRLDFRVLLDRASISSPDFLAFQAAALGRGRDVIDPADRVRWASDKATMHLEFIAHGINTPYTLILPPAESDRNPPLSPAELLPLGSPFVIKPANTTGGCLGVVEDARGIEDALAARQAYPSDKYLLQETIVPEARDGRRFWFRGFYILGDVHCTWWDPKTHVYAELTDEDAGRYGLEPLPGIVRTVAAVSGLRFFSTEIVRDVRGRLVSVDYVNETCDMRVQSKHADGVPDALVRKIAGRIASYAGETRTDGPALSQTGPDPEGRAS
ncbi:MAG TPA: hypothetical protein VEG35_05040 [Burkholderiales bacterium]|nr:hypothetical protein [Burkholderiales bacterium]